MTGAFAELYSWCPIVTTASEKGGGGLLCYDFLERKIKPR